MSHETSPHIVLALNGGSSSLKFGVYNLQAREEVILKGQLSRIGHSSGQAKLEKGTGELISDKRQDFRNYQEALEFLFHQLQEFPEINHLRAIGHRVVQGGPRHTQPELITEELIKELRSFCSLDPVHLPGVISQIERSRTLWQKVDQVACFDTTFHRTMPKIAQRIPLPKPLTEDLGVIRYGFHGLSYEYIRSELQTLGGPDPLPSRVIIAHLGNGTSLAALQDGQSMETTMGFTPAGGVMMGSRSGNLDPGVLIYLLQEKKVSVEGLNDLVYRQSGLQAVSQISSDMQELEAAAVHDPRAAEAIELFCYQVRQSIGALAAVLDGLDLLVFTGGIGAHSPAVRQIICSRLSFLGLQLDPQANQDNSSLISSPSSTLPVRVLKTNEEMIIARQTAHILSLT